MQSSTTMFTFQGPRLTSMKCSYSLSCAGRFSSKCAGGTVNARVSVRGSHASHTGHHTVELDRVATPIPLLIQNDTSSEVQQLRDSLQELVSTVRAQQLTLAQQQATIQQLQGTVEQLQSSTVQPLSNPLAANPQQQQQQEQHTGSSFVWDSSIRPYEAQKAALWDRRARGLYDARYHSTSVGATPPDRRVLPDRIILVRHAQSEGNVDAGTYTYIPDPQVPLTAVGCQQAHEAGSSIRHHMEAAKGSTDYKLYFYTSPYKRSLQTYEGIRDAFASQQVSGMQEEVQLREQDFGNFQDAAGKEREKAERLRFGRFFYRFPNGESGADVYDRITVFQDHLIRDINAGRFANNTSLVLVTHGLALRIFLMRWFHWSVDQFMHVYNPANAVPVILERMDPGPGEGETFCWHTKSMYRLTSDSLAALKGCTADMCIPPVSYYFPGESGFDNPGRKIGYRGGFDGFRYRSENAEVESAWEQWAELGGGW